MNPAVNHMSYRLEAMEKAESEVEVLRMELSEPMTPLRQIELEAAYRRGYFQGYCAALRDTKGFATRQKMEDFLYETLHPWRISRHNGKLEPPPEL
jgi:hypothetical protein